jgi:hypothetical protein
MQTVLPIAEIVLLYLFGILVFLNLKMMIQKCPGDFVKRKASRHAFAESFGHFCKLPHTRLG